MKLEPISKEMFDKLYNIFWYTNDSHAGKNNCYTKALERVKEKGLIKKTALEQAREYLPQFITREICSDGKSAAVLHEFVSKEDYDILKELYEKAIEEKQGEK